MPRLGRWMDGQDRLALMRRAVGAQIAAVLLIAALVVCGAGEFGARHGEIVIALFSVLAAIASIGAALTHTAVSADWIPSLFHSEARVRVNGRMKQIDLACEIVAPLLAGLILGIDLFEIHSFGFLTVALLNVFSFFFEYRVVRGLYADAKNALVKTNRADSPSESFQSRWKKFFAQAAAPTMLGYALLWLTVMTPHGAVLTSFLSSTWHLDETTLGFFRGGGALCGLIAALAVPRLLRVIEIRFLGFLFVAFEAICVLLSTFAMQFGSTAYLSMLLLICLSRFGLYGYSICEIQLRQNLVPEHLRGEMTGALTSIANLCALIIMVASIYFSANNDFVILGWISTFGIVAATLLVGWSWRRTQLRRVAT